MATRSPEASPPAAAAPAAEDIWLKCPGCKEIAFRKEVERKQAEAAELQKAADAELNRARQKEKAADELERSVKDKPKESAEIIRNFARN